MTDDQITVTTASGFVVVSEWADSNGRNAESRYERYATLNDALYAYREYDDGEWGRARAMGIFACNESGLPLRTLEPTLLIRLLKEMRRAA